MADTAEMSDMSDITDIDLMARGAQVLTNRDDVFARSGCFDHAIGCPHDAGAPSEEFERDNAGRHVRSILDEVATHESITRRVGTS